jgi:hypothetical protein
LRDRAGVPDEARHSPCPYGAGAGDSGTAGCLAGLGSPVINAPHRRREPASAYEQRHLRARATCSGRWRSPVSIVQNQWFLILCLGFRLALKVTRYRPQRGMASISTVWRTKSGPGAGRCASRQRCSCRTGSCSWGSVLLSSSSVQRRCMDRATSRSYYGGRRGMLAAEPQFADRGGT